MGGVAIFRRRLSSQTDTGRMGADIRESVPASMACIVRYSSHVVTVPHTVESRAAGGNAIE
jgi:hypothetical protein